MLTPGQLKEILEHYVAGWTIIAGKAPMFITQKHVEIMGAVVAELEEMKKDQEKLDNLSRLVTLDS